MPVLIEICMLTISQEEQLKVTQITTFKFTLKLSLQIEILRQGDLEKWKEEKVKYGYLDIHIFHMIVNVSDLWKYKLTKGKEMAFF